MIKKLLTLLTAVAILTACGTNKDEKKGTEEGAVAQVEFA